MKNMRRGGGSSGRAVMRLVALVLVVAAATCFENCDGGADMQTDDIRVSPSILEFGESDAYFPVTRELEIHNPTNRPVTVLAVLSKDINFQSTRFHRTILEPGARIRTPIIFLARSLGKKDGKIVVMSSVGDVKVTCAGQAKQNPYRFKDLTHFLVPVSTLVTPPIEIYNPYDRVFKVTEVYTTETFLNLELPGNAHAATPGIVLEDSNLWRLEPHETKPIINLALHFPEMGVFQGYIHIKLETEAVYILPIEIKVVADVLLMQPEIIKFRTLISTDDSQRKVLSLRNLGDKFVMITAIRPAKTDPKLQIDTPKGLVVPPFSTVTAANLTYTGLMPGKVKGKIFVYTNQTVNKIKGIRTAEFQYSGKVVHGNLTCERHMLAFPIDVRTVEHHNPTQSTYSIGSSNGSPLRVLREHRVMVFTNSFDTPLRIRSISLDDATNAGGQLSMVNDTFTPRMVVKPRQQFTLCAMELKPDWSSCGAYHCVFQTVLKVRTNVTTFRFPLHVYTSQLSITSHSFLPSSEYLDKYMPVTSVSSNSTFVILVAVTGGSHGRLSLGTVAVGETRHHVFLLANHNPVPIYVRRSQAAVRWVSLQLVHPVAGDRKLQPHELPTAPPTSITVIESTVLAPGESVYLLVTLRAKEEAKDVSGSIYVETDKEMIDVLVSFSSVAGDIQTFPAPLGGAPFDSLFPGRRSLQLVQSLSTFTEPIQIYNVTCQDPRFRIELGTDVLLPNIKRRLGQLSFDPSLGSLDDNYMLDLLSPDHFAPRAPLVTAGKSRRGAAPPVAPYPPYPSTAFASQYSGGRATPTPEDFAAVARASRIWSRLQDAGQTQIKTSLIITSNVRQRQTVDVRASLIFPSLFNKLSDRSLDFDTVAIHNTSELLVRVHNPSDWPVAIYPLHSPSVTFLPLPTNGAKSGAGGGLSITSIGDRPAVKLSAADSPVFRWKSVGATTIVAPRGTVTVGPIVFSPTAMGVYEGELYLRNNFTRLATVYLSGAGGRGFLSFRADVPGVTSSGGKKDAQTHAHARTDGHGETSRVCDSSACHWHEDWFSSPSEWLERDPAVHTGQIHSCEEITLSRHASGGAQRVPSGHGHSHVHLQSDQSVGHTVKGGADGNAKAASSLTGYVPLVFNLTAFGVLQNADGKFYRFSRSSPNGVSYNTTEIVWSLRAVHLTAPFTVFNTGNLPLVVHNVTMTRTVRVPPCARATAGDGAQPCGFPDSAAAMGNPGSSEADGAPAAPVVSSVTSDLCASFRALKDGQLVSSALPVDTFSLSSGCDALPLTLAPGQSRTFSLSYRPDYSVWAVEEDILVGTDWGNHVIPVRLSLPSKLAPLFIDTPTSSARLFSWLARAAFPYVAALVAAAGVLAAVMHKRASDPIISSKDVPTIPGPGQNGSVAAITPPALDVRPSPRPVPAPHTAFDKGIDAVVLQSASGPQKGGNKGGRATEKDKVAPRVAVNGDAAASKPASVAVLSPSEKVEKEKGGKRKSGSAGKDPAALKSPPETVVADSGAADTPSLILPASNGDKDKDHGPIVDINGLSDAQTASGQSSAAASPSASPTAVRSAKGKNRAPLNVVTAQRGKDSDGEIAQPVPVSSEGKMGAKTSKFEPAEARKSEAKPAAAAARTPVSRSDAKEKDREKEAGTLTSPAALLSIHKGGMFANGKTGNAAQGKAGESKVKAAGVASAGGAATTNPTAAAVPKPVATAVPLPPKPSVWAKPMALPVAAKPEPAKTPGAVDNANKASVAPPAPLPVSRARAAAIHASPSPSPRETGSAKPVVLAARRSSDTYKQRPLAGKADTPGTPQPPAEPVGTKPVAPDATASDASAVAANSLAVVATADLSLSPASQHRGHKPTRPPVRRAGTATGLTPTAAGSSAADTDTSTGHSDAAAATGVSGSLSLPSLSQSSGADTSDDNTTPPTGPSESAAARKLKSTSDLGLSRLPPLAVRDGDRDSARGRRVKLGGKLGGDGVAGPAGAPMPPGATQTLRRSRDGKIHVVAHVWKEKEKQPRSGGGSGSSQGISSRPQSARGVPGSARRTGGVVNDSTPSPQYGPADPYAGAVDGVFLIPGTVNAPSNLLGVQPPAAAGPSSARNSSPGQAETATPRDSTGVSPSLRPVSRKGLSSAAKVFVPPPGSSAATRPIVATLPLPASQYGESPMPSDRSAASSGLGSGRFGPDTDRRYEREDRDRERDRVFPAPAPTSLLAGTDRVRTQVRGRNVFDPDHDMAASRFRANSLERESSVASSEFGEDKPQFFLPEFVLDDDGSLPPSIASTPMMASTHDRSASLDDGHPPSLLSPSLPLAAFASADAQRRFEARSLAPLSPPVAMGAPDHPYADWFDASAQPDLLEPLEPDNQRTDRSPFPASPGVTIDVPRRRSTHETEVRAHRSSVYAAQPATRYEDESESHRARERRHRELDVSRAPYASADVYAARDRETADSRFGHGAYASRHHEPARASRVDPYPSATAAAEARYYDSGRDAAFYRSDAYFADRARPATEAERDRDRHRPRESDRDRYRERPDRDGRPRYGFDGGWSYDQGRAAPVEYVQRREDAEDARFVADGHVAYRAPSEPVPRSGSGSYLASGSSSNPSALPAVAGRFPTSGHQSGSPSLFAMDSSAPPAPLPGTAMSSRLFGSWTTKLFDDSDEAGPPLLSSARSLRILHDADDNMPMPPSVSLSRSPTMPSASAGASAANVEDSVAADELRLPDTVAPGPQPASSTDVAHLSP